MATSPNLPLGAFITTLQGRRCTALPRTDINTQTSTTSTFSTSLISTTSIAQVAPAPAIVNTPAVQNTVIEQSNPPPVAATTATASIGQFSIIATSSEPSSTPESSSSLSSSSSTLTSTPQPPLSAAVAVPPQASVTDTTTAALSTVPLTTATPAAAATTPPTSQAAQSEVLGSGNTTPFTTIGLASSTVGSNAQATNGAGLTSSSSSSSTGLGSKSGSNGNSSTIAVAGGVIGGVALISLIAFFIWFWRRRWAQKRRDTLLTPLSADPSFGREVRSEKGPYLIHRDSIGPTPRSTKVKAALRAQYGRVRGRFDTIARSRSVSSVSSHAPGRSVDMNRGNSQFMDASPINTHSRNNSSALSARNDGDMSIKERIMEMWARFKGSGKQELSGDEKNDIFAARGIAGGSKGKTSPSSRPLANKPDFLTLLNMDDNELDREAQRLRMSRTRGGSEGSGLGGLNLDFGEDPFSDLNAVSTSNQRPGPPMASGANNPFSDANAIGGSIPRKPSNYVADIRRSRGQSIGSFIDMDKAYNIRGLRVVNEEAAAGSAAGGIGTARGQSFYRDSQVSAASFESFTTKRDKFRSDPFDLEQLSSQVSGSIPNYTSRAMYEHARLSSSGSISQQYQMSVGSLGAGILSRPPAAHTRHLSDTSSKYTSGISEGTLAEWSDPGPDVGPAATRYDASRRSSGADVFTPFIPGRASSRDGGSRRSSRTGSIQMGYAL